MNQTDNRRRILTQRGQPAARPVLKHGPMTAYGGNGHEWP